MRSTAALSIIKSSCPNTAKSTLCVPEGLQQEVNHLSTQRPILRKSPKQPNSAKELLRPLDHESILLKKNAKNSSRTHQRGFQTTDFIKSRRFKAPLQQTDVGDGGDARMGSGRGGDATT